VNVGANLSGSRGGPDKARPTIVKSALASGSLPSPALNRPDRGCRRQAGREHHAGPEKSDTNGPGDRGTHDLVDGHRGHLARGGTPLTRHVIPRTRRGEPVLHHQEHCDCRYDGRDHHELYKSGHRAAIIRLGRQPGGVPLASFCFLEEHTP
jgi:hypothetical protein